MPIKGLTNDRCAAFPRLGTLRKGDRRPGEKQPGADLKYFRFDTPDVALAQAFARVYGDEPVAIPVRFYYATTEQNFTAWREEWTAGGLARRCDGETCVLRRTLTGYDTAPVPCECARRNGNPRCRPVGRLIVMLPDLLAQARRAGFVVALTTSLHDIMTLTGNLRALHALRGDLRVVPAILRRSPRMVSTPTDDGRRVRREKWLLSLEPDPVWLASELDDLQRRALPASMFAPPAEIEMPADEDEEDDEDGAQPPASPARPPELSEAQAREMYRAALDEAAQRGLTGLPAPAGDASADDVGRVAQHILEECRAHDAAVALATAPDSPEDDLPGAAAPSPAPVVSASRPYDPQALRARLSRRAAALANAAVSANQRRTLARALEGVCGGPEGRDTFLRHLGAGAIGDLSPGWVLALLEWGSGNAAKAALASAEARALMASAA